MNMTQASNLCVFVDKMRALFAALLNHVICEVEICDFSFRGGSQGFLPPCGHQIRCMLVVENHPEEFSGNEGKGEGAGSKAGQKGGGAREEWDGTILKVTGWRRK